MDVKLKNEIDFEKYYQSEYKDVIFEYYNELKEKKKFNIILCSVFAIIIMVLFISAIDILNFKTMLGESYVKVVIICFALIMFGTILVIYASLKKEMLKLNETIIKNILAFISGANSNDIVFEPKLMLSREAFDKMELFNLDVVKYTGKNYLKVPYNKNIMVFSDMNTFVYDTVVSKKIIYKEGKKYLRTTRSKKRRTIYEGMYIGATLNKNNSNHIYLIPNNLNDTVLQSKLMSYIKFHGVPVMLENLEFSKKYKVFCDDEVQARYILSLSLMEKINKVDSLFKGKKYIVFKEGKRFAICIEGLSIEKIKNMTLPPFRKENKELKVLTNIFSELNKLIEIYHILDLGNDLYVKDTKKVTNTVLENKNVTVANNTSIKKDDTPRVENINKEKTVENNVKPQEKVQNNSNNLQKTVTKEDFMSSWY